MVWKENYLMVYRVFDQEKWSKGNQGGGTWKNGKKVLCNGTGDQGNQVLDEESKF